MVVTRTDSKLAAQTLSSGKSLSQTSERLEELMQTSYSLQTQLLLHPLRQVHLP